MRKALIAGVLLVAFFAANRGAIAAPHAATAAPASTATASSSIVSFFLSLLTGYPVPPAPGKAPGATLDGACPGNFPTPRFGNCP